jgi:hypothetical protein
LTFGHKRIDYVSGAMLNQSGGYIIAVPGNEGDILAETVANGISTHS